MLEAKVGQLRDAAEHFRDLPYLSMYVLKSEHTRIRRYFANMGSEASLN